MTDLKINKRIPGPKGEVFVLTERLGAGAFGEVHKALGESSGEAVAVKSIPAASSLDVLALRAALNEARPEMTSIRHPNVVETLFVSDGDKSPIGPFIVNEYVAGGTLEEFLHDASDRDEMIPLEMALDLMTGIALGAQAINEKLVHRDVKPDNILLADVVGRLRPKIGDFGIAKVVAAATRPSKETFKGTAPILYRAPETFVLDAPNTPKIDVYSVGIVFNEILTLNHPLAPFVPEHADWTDWMHAHQFKIPDDPRARRPEIPRHVAALVRRMMAKLPAERSDWNEVLRVLETAHAPIRPRRASPALVAAFEASADGANQQAAVEARRAAAAKAESQKHGFILANAGALAKAKLVEFDEYFDELSGLRPDRPVVSVVSDDSNRVWRLPNGQDVRCEIWVPGQPIPTERGLVVAGGFVGVDGGSSCNLALLAPKAGGGDAWWIALELDVHPLAQDEARQRVMREVGLSKNTIAFMEGLGFAQGWLRNQPLRFGISSAQRFFEFAPGIGHQGKLDMMGIGEVEKAFERVVACALAMSERR